uniref:Mediator of RNA polymerase II transcription subunit 14 n=3 Tax=Kalanchoe fedtschenkoi TaxID=63787 RepID=A0A7N0UT70_KALFE
MADELGQQTVDFATLVARAAEDSYLSLRDLVDHSTSDQSDAEKKIGLLKFIHKTQQRMLRLNVLSKWCRQIPLIQYCQQLGSTLSFHDTCFTQAADSMYFMHESLQQARAPIYDVSSAIEILLTGTYEKFPKCVEDVGMQASLTEERQKSALRKLDTLMRSKLLEAPLPKEFSWVMVSDGTASIQVDGEFKVLLTLGYRGHLTLWRILNLELLVGEKSGLIKLEKTRMHVLGDDLERRMAESENPFRTLYSVLHELCLALVMDTVIRQVQVLRKGRWKDAIRFEILADSTGQGGISTSAQMNQDINAESAGLRTPGLKLIYWLDIDRNSSASDSGSYPFMRIEPGSDSQIKCVHSTFIIDPATGKETVLTLDHGCIDVEKLLLEAICSNRYTRLLEIHKQLTENSQICQAPGDVVLQTPLDEISLDNKQQDSKLKENERQEVLRVRAYGSLFFTLRISIRNGRFILRSSKNVLALSVLLDSEEALNQSNTTAAEIFCSLRCRSILHFFASLGRFLGLEVFERGSAPVKVPKNIHNGSTSLLLGFPDCGCAYYLLIELDKDFKPLFNLMETRPELSGKVNVSADFNNVIRIKKINLAEIQMVEDEVNLSLPDIGKILSAPKNSDVSKEGAEQTLFPDLGLQGSTQTLSFHSSSFSFAVDDVFDFEKGVSASSLAVQNASLSSKQSLGSQFGALPTENIKPGRLYSKWNEDMSIPRISEHSLSGASLKYVGWSHSSSNVKGSALSSQESGASKKLSASKSDQDLASLKASQQLEVGTHSSLDDNNLRLVHDGSKEASIMCSSATLLSPSHPSSMQVFGPIMKPPGVRSSPSRFVNVSESSSWISTSISQAPESANCDIFALEATFKDGNNKKKRTISDLVKLVPSLLNTEPSTLLSKRRKLSVPAHVCDNLVDPVSLKLVNKADGHNYSKIIEEANKGNASSSIYISALLHVFKHCSLSIKHARLTSQMKALDIPFIEESGFRDPSLNLWFRLPFARSVSWPKICLRLGIPGSMHWDVKITDKYFQDLWELQKGNSNTPWGCGVRIANTSDVDSHIRFDAEGVVLSYQSVEPNSIKKLVADIRRLSHARMFSLGMRELLGVRVDDKTDESGIISDCEQLSRAKTLVVGTDKLSEQLRRAFRIEAVGLMSLWFSFGSGILARFVVEWDVAKEGCTMHVSPEQIWPHTKFLEDFINEAEVASLLDCIRLTAGPLHALAAATRPARASPVPYVPGVTGAIASSIVRQSGHLSLQGQLQNTATTQPGQAAPGSLGIPVMSNPTGLLGNHSFHSAAIMSAAGRGGPGIVPSSLLPIDVSVVLRGPYWVRIIYRKHFAVDMRCFAGDQVWLQPATPPKGGPSVGGSLPCPQFRPFIMEHVAQELNGLDPNISGGQLAMGLAHSSNQISGSTAHPSTNPSTNNGNRGHLANAAGLSRQGNQVSGVNRTGNAVSGPSNLTNASLGLALRRSPATGVPAHVRGELNTAIIGLGDDGGYGGGWVPLLALKKVLRGILKYLGVLWLFAQLPDLLREILGSILRDNEGALLNLDQEQPALRFFVGGYVFAVSVHRVQLLLQVLSVKRFSQQQQPQQNSSPAQEELTSAEIGEICDYFSRRVASEPYDASRVASFITLLTLPISILREFLKLIAWKKGLVQAQVGDMAPTQKPRIELCLENHVGFCRDENSDTGSTSKTNIHYDRPNNSVDFGLTVVLDPSYIPHINAAGGAAWLPYCVSVRLRYSFAENHAVSLIRMEGSHGGRACWVKLDDWERCKQSVSRTVDVSGGSTVDSSQGRLRVVADNIQRTLHTCLQGLRDGVSVTGGT